MIIYQNLRLLWLTIFGADDIVVPTDICVKNITSYMNQSGNKEYEIVIIPKCGHAPVSSETGEMVRIDHIFINWLNENGF
jgi:pimeloyl-ACP methyl ester carboxylesterase